jgi:hypothetical protein
MPRLTPREDERERGRLSHPPSLTIVVELEGRPELYIDALHFEDEQRLRSWLERSPGIAALLDEALALRERRVA